MSSKIEIDFNNLKFNLYEILDVSKDADAKKINKNFRKLVLYFHPDHNKESNDEIYNTLIIAKQILSNDVTRKQYDDFLNFKESTHIDFKKSFKKAQEQVQSNPSKPEKSFNQMVEEMNKKHGYDEGLNSVPISARFAELKNKRSFDVNIKQENIRDNGEFNSKFENRKKSGSFDGQIIAVESNNQIMSYNSYDNYSGINDIDKLYTNDDHCTTNYSSINRAFTLSQLNVNVDTKKSMEERMSEYKRETDEYKKGKFKNQKFEDWKDS